MLLVFSFLKEKGQCSDGRKKGVLEKVFVKGQVRKRLARQRKGIKSDHVWERKKENILICH